MNLPFDWSTQLEFLNFKVTYILFLPLSSLFFPFRYLFRPCVHSCECECIHKDVTYSSFTFPLPHLILSSIEASETGMSRSPLYCTIPLLLDLSKMTFHSSWMFQAQATIHRERVMWAHSSCRRVSLVLNMFFCFIIVLVLQLTTRNKLKWWNDIKNWF